MVQCCWSANTNMPIRMPMPMSMPMPNGHATPIPQYRYTCTPGLVQEKIRFGWAGCKDTYGGAIHVSDVTSNSRGLTGGIFGVLNLVFRDLTFHQITGIIINVSNWIRKDRCSVFRCWYGTLGLFYGNLEDYLPKYRLRIIFCGNLPFLDLIEDSNFMIIVQDSEDNAFLRCMFK